MSSNPSTFLDAILMKLVEQAGTLLPTRSSLNFIGAGFTLTDNAANDSTDVGLTSAPTVAPITLDGSSTGTITLSPVQLAAGYIAITGAIANNVALSFGTPPRGQTWIVDASALGFSAHAVTLVAGGVTWGTVLNAQGVWRVTFNGTKFYGNAITP